MPPNRNNRGRLRGYRTFLAQRRAPQIAFADPVLDSGEFRKPLPLAGPRLFLLARLRLLQLGPVGDTVLPLALGFQHGLLLGLVGKKLDR